RAPRLHVRRCEVTFERCVVGPQFGEADEAGLERVEGGVIGDTAIVTGCGLDDGLEVGKHIMDAVLRKAEGAEHGDLSNHRDILSNKKSPGRFPEGLQPGDRTHMVGMMRDMMKGE